MNQTVKVEGGVLQWQEMEGLKDGNYEVKFTSLDTRTAQQNSSIWLWMTMIANTLNAENITVPQLLRPDVHWDSDKVRYMVLQPLIEAQFNVKSTTKIRKQDFDLLIKSLTKAMGLKGITIPAFPTQVEKEKEDGNK